ncbi:MAG: spore coat protein U domain-containing protein [Thermodesulfobacteriota bacterium]
MKKFLSLIMVLGLVLVLGRVSMAADTNTVTVTANVVGTCRFNSATSTLAFGGLDPSSGLAVNASTSTTFWCTRNATYSVTDDDGLNETAPDANRMQHTSSPTEYIPYTFSYNPTTGNGQGRTSPITLNISGTVAFADYQDAAAGDYSDTVVISITP